MAKQEAKVETKEVPIAYELAKKQKEISVAEFFTKNRHLLGFDNKRKALLMAVKEAVDNSVEYNEPVLIRENNRVKLIKIGEYIDKILKDTTSEIEQDYVESVPVKNVESLVYNNKTFKLEFKPISKLHRHKLQDKLYKITLTGNRSVTVTGSHSIFALKNDKVMPYEVKDLKEGDYVVVPRGKLSIQSDLEFIDLRQWAIELYRKYNKKISVKKVAEQFSGIPRDWKRFDYVPIEYFIRNNIEIPTNAEISIKFGRSSIPVILPINECLMRLLGYYAAEGTCYEQWITLSFGLHEKTLIEDAIFCIRELFKNVRAEKVLAHSTAITVKIYSEILSYLFKYNFSTGSKAYNKNVPDLIFNVSNELQLNYLYSYIAGDGHIGKKITLATVSKDLAIGIKYLLAINGLPFSEYIREESVRIFKKYKSDCKKVFYIYIYPQGKYKNSPLNWMPIDESGFRTLIKELNPKIGSFNPHYRMISDKDRISFTFDSMSADIRLALVQRRTDISQEQEEKIQYLSSVLNGNIGFLKVKKIENVISNNNYVYDFSVPGEEKFLGGEGVIFLHNSLDACEEARVLPEISVEIIEMSEFKYKVIVEDNGPGIVKKQIPNIFAKLLYGSKFHTLKQARGQQGIGISAAVLYSQLTTGRAVKITSRVSKKEPAFYYELNIDTQNNKPVIAKEETVEWPKEHGTKIELDLEGEYIKGNQSVDEYLKQTAVINPHVTIIYTNPKSEQVIYARATDKLPSEPKEIKPHPYGIELGMLMDKLRWTESRTLQSFLTSEFSRVGPGTAKEVCEHAAILPNTKPSQVSRDMAEKLLQGIQKTKIIAPPTDCLSPIGEELLEKGLRKEIRAEFYAATSRSPSVYRGNPFLIEAAIIFGGEIPKEEKVNILRFANRVPLLYQEGACAMAKSIMETNWKPYGLQQSGDTVPFGPVVIVVHMASVWVPFTSESKEAIAHYAEIVKEIKLALQECGRLLGTYVRKKYRISEQIERANMFEKYIPEIADSLSVLTHEKKDKILQGLQKMLVKPEIKKEITEEDADDKLYKMEFSKKSDENEETREEAS